MALVSPILKRRWKKFKSLKRGYYSFIILVVCYVLTLFASFWINNKPFYVKYEGRSYYPVFNYYSDEEFGGEYLTEAQYKEINKTERFAEGNPQGNYMIFMPVPYGENEAVLGLKDNPPTSPDSQNWFGTDDRGRDLFTRVVYGFRVSMTFALLILALNAIIGVSVGAIQGYFGGVLDLTFQRFIEVLAAVPFLYLMILLASIFEPSFVLLISVFCVFRWISISYYMRAEFLRARKKEYVEAARAIGVSTPGIIFKHILPNTLTPLITLSPFVISGAIFSLSMLDFLGFGVPPPTASWGEILGQAMGNLSDVHLSLFPIMALFLTLLLINFVGEAIREAFDPKPYFRYKG